MLVSAVYDPSPFSLTDNTIRQQAAADFHNVFSILLWSFASLRTSIKGLRSYLQRRKRRHESGEMTHASELVAAIHGSSAIDLSVVDLHCIIFQPETMRMLLCENSIAYGAMSVQIILSKCTILFFFH